MLYSLPPEREVFFFCGGMMRNDSFSALHPAVCFFFFLGAVVTGMVFTHPAYLAVSLCAASAYWLTIQKGRGGKTLLRFLPLFLALSLINPLFSSRGEHVLFTVFSRPFTLEALYYGMAAGAMFVSVLLWFLSYDRVITSDKLTALFGGLLPSLSLLLVMVLRFVPGCRRQAEKLAGARRSIGHGVNADASKGEKLRDGAAILSALASWTLEGAVITADSMRARGYGSGTRSRFKTFRFTARDGAAALALLLLLLFTIIPATGGAAGAEYLPALRLAPVRGFRNILALTSYALFLFAPTLFDLWEALKWHILRSKL